MVQVALRGQLPHCAHWVYFHGDAVEWADQNQRDRDWHAPDLVSATVELNYLSDGVYDVVMYGRPAVLYLWTVPQSYSFYKTKGLIVLPGTDGEKQAQEHFRKKSPML
jgi:hypothetical protein